VVTLTLYKQEFFGSFLQRKNCLLSSVCRIDRAALARVTLIATWYKKAFFFVKKPKNFYQCRGGGY
jgi:hypothetical protein